MLEIKKHSQAFKKPYYPFKERMNFKKLIKCNGDYSNLSITFKYADGSIKTLDTNEEFFKNEKNKPLSLTSIIENINSLKHDFQAVEYNL